MRIIVVALLLVLLSAPCQGEADLLRYDGVLLQSSKWGVVGTMQSALASNPATRDCPPFSGIDGKFGRETMKSLCCLAQHFRLPETCIEGGVRIGSTFWEKLAPAVPLPSVQDRAVALTFNFESTDYDRIEWNFGTADNKSGVTWGPYGATLGYGNEIGNILVLVRQRDDSILAANVPAGEEGALAVLLSLDAGQSFAVFQTINGNRDRREKWTEFFRALSRSSVVREAYDHYAFVSNKWIQPNMRRMYSIFHNLEYQPTQVDYALFLDLSVHASVTEERVQAIRKRILEAGGQGRLRPPMVRKVIGDAFCSFVSAKWKNHRLARNMVYYMDDQEMRERCSPAELKTWRSLGSGLKASFFGLQDQPYRPDYLQEHPARDGGS